MQELRVAVRLRPPKGLVLLQDWEVPFGPSSPRGVHFLDGLVEDFEPDEESLYRDAVAYLKSTLDACLAEFQVHIDVGGLGEPEPAGEPTLYAAMGLQLADHIARRMDYKRCKNEKCRRLFVRQRGSRQRPLSPGGRQVLR